MTESILTRTLTDGQRDITDNTQQKVHQMTPLSNNSTRLLQIQEEEEDLSNDTLLTTDNNFAADRPSSKLENFTQAATKAAFSRMPSHVTNPHYDQLDQLTAGKAIELTEDQIFNDHENESVDEEKLSNEDTGENVDDNIFGDDKSESTELPYMMKSLSFADEDYDTDLNNTDSDEDDESSSYYKTVCEQLGLAPVEYFLRNIEDRNITMRYRGLGSEEIKAIALTLRNNAKLECLDISGNWIGPEGARLMCRLLEENDYISDVVLADNKILSDGGLYVAKMILVNAGLRKLDLSGNGLDDKCAEALASALESNKYLKDINLSHNNFTEVGAQFLGPAIGSNENLDTLNLSWNHFRERGGTEIAKGLKENVRLKVCDLSWNGLAVQGGLAIAEAMTVNQSLKELDLSGNRLTFPVAAKMASALATNDSIKILKMGNNLITSAGAIALASAINNTESCELELLDLTDVPVDYEFQRTVDDVMMKRPNFKFNHGPLMRAGNTNEDLSKPAIDVGVIKKQPIVLLKCQWHTVTYFIFNLIQEHIIVNDLRIIDILKRHDKSKAMTISVDDFFTALEELGVPYDKLRLKESLLTFQGCKSGKIHFGNYISHEQSNEKSKEDGS